MWFFFQLKKVGLVPNGIFINNNGFDECRNNYRYLSGEQNETVILELPYRTRVFFELDTTAFWLMWTYQLPEIYLNTFQTATIGYLFSLILHVCGQMSVLAHRIKNINLGPREEDRSSRIVFQDIVKRHQNILV